MNQPKLIFGILALLLIASGAALLKRLKNTQRLGQPGVKIAGLPGTNGLKVDLPERVLDFTSQEMEPTDGEKGILPKDTTFGKRLYLAPDGFQVFVSVVLMGTDRSSIHKPEFCLTGQGWNIDQRETVSVPMERPQPYQLPVRLFTATKQMQATDGRRGAVRGLYAFWFVAEDELSASHWGRQWSMGRELIRTGTLQRWAYVALLGVCPPGREAEAFTRMKQFMGAIVPEFQLTTGKPIPRPLAGRDRSPEQGIHPREINALN